MDKKAPPEIRAQAQGLIVLICFGVGMLIGTFVNVELIEHYTTGDVCNWNPVFMIAALISTVLLVVFIAVFKDDVKETASQVDGETPADDQSAEA